MQYRKLGSSDLVVSEICLGSWLTYGGGVRASRPRPASALPSTPASTSSTPRTSTRAAGGGVPRRGAPGLPRDGYVLATKLYFPMSATDRGLSPRR